MFYLSQSEPERQHMIKALRFELGMVVTVAIRERMIGHLAQIDAALAQGVAKGLGVDMPKKSAPPPNMHVPADGDAKAFQHRQVADRDILSPALSMTSFVPGPIATRKVAILVTEKFEAAGVAAMQRELEAEGARGLLVAPELGELPADDGSAHVPAFSILTAASVLFDAVYVAGGKNAPEWLLEADAIEFVKDAYKHCKAVAATGEGVQLLEAAGIDIGGDKDPRPADDATIIAGKVNRDLTASFVTAMANHRLWSREPELHLPL